MQQVRRESRDPERRDKVEDFQLAADYWYSSRNLKNIPDMNAALEEVLPYALKQSPEITDYQTWEQAHEYKSYHDAGAILLAKCYTLLYYGHDIEARKSIDLIDQKLRFSMKLERDRGTTWVRRNLRYHEHFCALYRMMLTKKFELCQFPMERDEFDGQAMATALEDMVRLRMLDGGHTVAEYLMNAARKCDLRRQDGRSVLAGFYEAFEPHGNEIHRESAWKEMRTGIERWREKQPTSISARVAEACYWLNYALHLNSESDAPIMNKNLAWKMRLENAEKVLNDTLPDCPGWYAAKVRLLDLQGAKPDQIAAVFQRGKAVYPKYESIHIAVCDYLRTADGLGPAACAGMVAEYAANNEPCMAAYCLKELVWRGAANAMTGTLDERVLRFIIQDAVTKQPLSLKWRSDLAYVSMQLGQLKPAQWCMRGMKNRWDRGTWRMHDNVVRMLATDGPLEGQTAVKTADKSS